MACTNTLGCQVEGWPPEYLGLPLGANLRYLEFWDPIVEKCAKKVSPVIRT